MSAEIKSDLQFRVGHVLFIDIVGYSDLFITEQHDYVELLNELVRSRDGFRLAEQNRELLCLPAGDGMAMVFSGTVEAAVECALEIAAELKEHPELRVRMGVHSGPISLITDVNDHSNVAGAGINLAQRVMSRGDAGHILLSRHVAEDLEQYPRWRPCLHDLGESEIKHGHKLGIVNCYTAEVGNPQLPLAMQPPSRVATLRRHAKMIALAGGALMAAAAALFFLRDFGSSNLDKSIAVLPFENLSDDKQNSYFADGIQGDVLTNLAKIGDLKVISRTSVMQYEGHPGSVREIGQALGVGAILEGSVRREGNRVRVNVELINARTDRNVWAENYDRELTDVFAIQSDLALQIASSLRSKLSPTEKARLRRAPTSNSEAYLIYLKGRDRVQHSHLQEGVDLFQQATQLDPTFALAFAHLSYAENTLYQASGNAALSEKAGAAAREALRLQPNLPEGHFALGYHYYRGGGDYDGALRELAIAQAGLPNDADVFLVTGSIKRRQGKWSESIIDLKRAAELNPKDPNMWANLGTAYQAVHDYTRAEQSFERGITADPDFFMNYWLRAQSEFERTGNLQPLQEAIQRTAAMTDPYGQIVTYRVQLKLLERKHQEALDLLNRVRIDWLLPWSPPVPVPRALLLGFIYRFMNQPARAETCFQQASQLLERALRENPNDASRHALLGQAYAGLGRKEEALREGQRAVELLPESKDASDGPAMTLALAKTEILLGDTDAALVLLKRSLATPGGVNIHHLELDPTWDSLRANSRFQEILTSLITPLTTNQKE